MILHRGITGFRHVDEPQLPLCSVRAFRGDCFRVARTLSGEILYTSDPANTGERNFNSVALDLRDGQIMVLLNAHFPVLAFAKLLQDDGTRIEFIDQEDAAKIFRATGQYEVLGKAELDGALNDELIRELAPAELEQIKYWKPARIGDVIFNYWD